jgi:hypothetical protein
MFSNYDCINSFWLESQGGYSYEESYFGAIVDALNLNPSKVKTLLLQHNVKCNGKFPNKANRNGKEYVNYEDFFQELENQSCGACLLVFVGKIHLSDFVTSQPIKSITIPKGNNCGLFSKFQGGGSLIEMSLQKDITIDLIGHGETEYDRYEFQADCEDEYSIDRVYGVTQSFWGKRCIVGY